MLYGGSYRSFVLFVKKEILELLLNVQSASVLYTKNASLVTQNAHIVRTIRYGKKNFLKVSFGIRS